LFMKNLFKSSALFALLLFLPSLVFSQTLELNLLNTFGAYSGAGAITNSGSLSGDVGSNDGIISGTFTGTIYNADAVTEQARLELLRIYIQISDIFVTYPGTHAPAFGNGESIPPGVYSIGGAGSVAGTLILDGGGDPNAFYIIKFEGALSIGAASNIVLANGTRSCNVFWVADGAIADAGGSIIVGSLLARPGAITIGVNSVFEGRMFASEGAITTGPGSVCIIPACKSTIPALCSDVCAPAAVVDVLGSVSRFVLFTSFGAVANTATSGLIGDIGTNDGVISGLTTSTNIGNSYVADSVTAQAKIDLASAYAQLMLLPITIAGHTPAFGSGETLNAGVYYIGGAGSLAGTVTLDAQNNPNAVFVFRFNGAFSVAAQAKVIFRNGTRRCNVYWISQGATDMGTFTFMKGTVIANNGACSMGANGNIEGRMLSTGGAIGFSTGVGYTDALCCVSPPPVLGGGETVCISGTANLSPTSGGIWSSNSSNVTITNAGVATGVSAGSSILSFLQTSTTCTSTKVVTVVDPLLAPSISCD
jgi:hypothetical protein